MPATPEEALYAKLAGTSTVNDAVGGRINPQVNTQEPALPLIVFKRVGGAPQPTLDGVGGLARYVFQIDVYAETESGAAEVAAAVDAAIMPAAGWRDTSEGVYGTFPDDTSVDTTDDPYRLWTRTVGIWFTPTS